MLHSEYSEDTGKDLIGTAAIWMSLGDAIKQLKRGCWGGKRTAKEELHKRVF
jgi:hypothetical protein